MKSYIREAIQELEALGFTYEPDPFGRAGKHAYSHPYEPETKLRLWDGASQSACIAIRRKANHIAGLGAAGPAMPKTIGERRSSQVATTRGHDVVELARHDRRAAADQERRVLSADHRRREIEALMQPGGAR